MVIRCNLKGLCNLEGFYNFMLLGRWHGLGSLWFTLPLPHRQLDQPQSVHTCPQMYWTVNRKICFSYFSHWHYCKDSLRHVLWHKLTLIWFSYQKKIVTKLKKNTKITFTTSSLLENPEIMNMQIFSFTSWHVILHIRPKKMPEKRTKNKTSPKA